MYKIYVNLTGKVSSLILILANKVRLDGVIPIKEITVESVKSLIDLTQYDSYSNIMNNQTFKDALKFDYLKAYDELGLEIDIKTSDTLEVFKNTNLTTGQKGVYNPDTDSFEELVIPDPPEVDLSGYQLTSQKNQSNGYVGLDGSGKILTDVLPTISASERDHKTLFFYENNFLTVAETNPALTTFISVQNGAGSTAGTGLAYIDPVGSTQISRPRAMINSGASGYISLFLPTNTISIASGIKITLKWVISQESMNAITSNSGVYVGFFNDRNPSSITAGIGFRRFGNSNSNKFECICFGDPSPAMVTLASTSLGLADRTLCELKLIMDFTNGVTTFYINNVLVHTESRSLFFIYGTNKVSQISNYSGVTSDAFSKLLYPHYTSILIEKN